MTVVFAVALALVIVALVLAVVVAHKRGQAHDALEAAHLQTEQALATAAAQRDELAAALEDARLREEELAAAREAASTDASAAADALAAARAELTQTRAQLNARRADELDPAATWQLELARVEREWRADGAPMPTSPSPLADAADPLAAAVQMRADCLRETVGFPSVVDWRAAPPPSPASALAWFRVADELLVQASRHADDVRFEAADDGAHVVFTVIGAPLPAEGAVLADAVAAAGGEIVTAATAGEADGGDVTPALVVRLLRPTRPEPDPEPTPAAEPDPDADGAP